MNIECPSCGYENAIWEIVEVVEGKGYTWEIKCDQCDWEDTTYVF